MRTYIRIYNRAASIHIAENPLESLTDTFNLRDYGHIVVVILPRVPITIQSSQLRTLKNLLGKLYKTVHKIRVFSRITWL